MSAILNEIAEKQARLNELRYALGHEDRAYLTLSEVAAMQAEIAELNRALADLWNQRRYELAERRA